MSNLKLAMGAIAMSMLFGSATMAQNTTTTDTQGGASGHMTKGAMASSADHKTMTKMDTMMVKTCQAMTHEKMMADKECQDYMKNHPDWMKPKQ